MNRNYKLSNYNSITNRIFLLLYGVRMYSMRTVSESGDIIKSYRFTNLHTYCRWKLGSVVYSRSTAACSHFSITPTGGVWRNVISNASLQLSPTFSSSKESNGVFKADTIRSSEIHTSVSVAAPLLPSYRSFSCSDPPQPFCSSQPFPLLSTAWSMLFVRSPHKTRQK